MMLVQFTDNIRREINKACAENGSNTPDSILATYLLSCLEAFNAAVNVREEWFGRTPTLLSDPFSPPNARDFEPDIRLSSDRQLVNLAPKPGIEDLVHSEKFVIMFLGFVCGDLEELHQLECPKILESWNRFKVMMEKEQ